MCLANTEGIMKSVGVFLTCITMLAASPYFERGNSAEGKISNIRKTETLKL